MKVLFIGGTGNISLPCVQACLAAGHTVYLLNRGKRKAPLDKKVIFLTADVRNPGQVKKLIADLEFDVVADFIAYEEAHIETAISLFSGKTLQYIFISSATVYHKPPRHYIINESEPLYNPYSEYARKKIACENRLMRAHRESGFPVTIVRPSHTYADGFIPLPLGSAEFTIPRRILEGREVFVHGDGESLWTVTHAADFAQGLVGLFGNPQAIGEAFHITSDQVYTWNAIFDLLGSCLGKKPRIIHIPSEFIARMKPILGEGLLGDKAYSCVFDNTKIKRVVPGFKATVPFPEGLQRSVSWLLADPARQIVNPELDRAIDEILAAYKAG